MNFNDFQINHPVVMDDETAHWNFVRTNFFCWVFLIFSAVNEKLRNILLIPFQQAYKKVYLCLQQWRYELYNKIKIQPDKAPIETIQVSFLLFGLEQNHFVFFFPHYVFSGCQLHQA